MLHRFERRHAQRFERLELRFQHRVLGHAIGMQLLVDPFLQADPLHAFDVAGPRPEREAIQRVQDLIVLRELLLEQLGLSLAASAGLGVLAPAMRNIRRMPQRAGARKVLLVFMSLQQLNVIPAQKFTTICSFRLLTMYYKTNTL